jgi:uncharacterized lipoprotein YajG
MELGREGMRFYLRTDLTEISMRAPIIIVLASLMLAACGSTEHKTVIVAPPAGSTTVVDKNGDAHVIRPDDGR